ncbi:MAG TPA: hypothetical protein VN622_14235 [Clostridia bacterium]|nr:hypothetical protein [Clostridia bacterium]
MANVEVPAAPHFLPKSQRSNWTKTYAQAFKQAQTDFPDDLSAQRAAALREANRMLRVPEPESYEAAMKLESWQVLKRDVVAIDNDASEFPKGSEVLKLVTADGKKFTFAVPPPPPPPPTKPAA